MQKADLIIRTDSGVHARPAAMFVKIANLYPCEIFVEKGEERVNGKSIMGILMLALSADSKITIITDGEKEEEALKALVKLVESDFSA